MGQVGISAIGTVVEDLFVLKPVGEPPVKRFDQDILLQVCLLRWCSGRTALVLEFGNCV